jgi:DNA-binding CsgD family transcriptional regulator
MLTGRQREVLQLIAEGYSTKQIANRLGIGVKTAETHRAQLMERLDIHNVADLVRYALRAGIVAPD